MPYEDWTPEFQEMWTELPVDFSELTPGQYEYAEFMFEEGFMHYEGEQDPADTEWAREEFYDTIGIEYEGFDWAGWREAMGYELPWAVAVRVPAQKPSPVTVRSHDYGRRLSVPP